LLQKQIAIDLGVSQECYSLYETGKREPDHQRLKQIAAYFDVSIDYLLDHAPPDREKTIDLRGLSEEDKVYLRETVELMKLRNKNKLFESAGGFSPKGAGT
jgi:transcriptional regulator with XRE-family HTH domain